MQYRNVKKIIIDKMKLDILMRLGCPDNQIIELIKTGNFTPTGDSVIDETLECLLDFKEFDNWGGKRPGSGRPKKHLENQDENQDENHLDNQDANQVVDKDKDIYNNLNNNNIYIFKKPSEEVIHKVIHIDEKMRVDEDMPEFKDMTWEECCRASEWLLEKMYCRTLPKDKFVEIVRKFKSK